jgi:hypothetical protein
MSPPSPPAYLLVLAEFISSDLKMEAICSSEMSVATQQTTRHHIPEDDTLNNVVFGKFLCGIILVSGVTVSLIYAVL